MSEIAKIVEKYLEFFPKDKLDLDLLLSQIEKEKDIFDRKNLIGHVVASALIINNNKVLTIFHNSLKRNLAPGGHVDAEDASVVAAALREAEEETGLRDLVLSDWHKQTGVPIFIESHIIPENQEKNEAEHYHHAFMHIFKTDIESIELQLNEVSDFLWIDIEKVLKENPDSFIAKSLKRALELGIIK